MTLAKAAVVLALLAIFFHIVLLKSPLVTLSPDSIRFMHFWQVNVDHFREDGGGAKSAVKAVFYSLRSSNNYDMSRGRVIQAALYGLDGLTRWMLPSPMFNVWMMALMTLNGALMAWLATRVVPDFRTRTTLFALAWLAVCTTALVMSPVMLLVLYAKYVWVAFVLCHFIARSKVMKFFWLAPAAFSDELGLFAAMLLTFLHVAHINLASPDLVSGPYSTHVRILKALLLGTAAAFTVMFSCFGISAVFFGGAAPEFLALAASASGGSEFLKPAAIWHLVNGLFWRAEIMILGSSLGHPAVTTLVGLAVLAVITVGIWKTCRLHVRTAALADDSPDTRILAWLGDERARFYAFWTIMLVVVAFVVVRVGAGDFTHYGYPAAAVLAVLFIRALLDVFSARAAGIVLLAMLATHLALLPQAISTTQIALEKYLFPDGTVSRQDIAAVQQSVMEFRASGASPVFEAATNGQEMDFTGTWFYSRVRSAESLTEPHFPFQGTVRVLLWPDRIHSSRYNADRIFDYKRPRFQDGGSP